MSRESKHVLVDTSVWIDFLRRAAGGMRERLLAGEVLIHSCVLGEFFAQLPRAREAEPAEALEFIESQHLWGRGLQWNDVLILAAAKLNAARDLRVNWSG